MATIKVSTKSSPNSVAAAIGGFIHREHYVDALIVGAGAMNQTMKAVAIARTHLYDEGFDLVCIPGFTTVDIDGDARTAMLLRIEHRPAAVIDLRETIPETAEAPVTSGE
jgi:stage V sporulation protein S